MSLTHSDLVDGFRALGVARGDVLLVHSALSSFGYVAGGATTVIQALLDVIGPDGTMMVPTLTGQMTDGPDQPPVFDVRATPSWTGTIPETFRLMPEARRSLHPTHSVAAIGARRDELIAGHETGDSPCDRMSPYYKNCMFGGSILLIGVDHESNTTVHCCEEIAEVPYHLHENVTEMLVTSDDGRTVTVRNRLHNWKKHPTDFNLLEPLLVRKGIQNTLRIGKSIVRRVRANDMLEVTVDVLRRNPLFLAKP